MGDIASKPSGEASPARHSGIQAGIRALVVGAALLCGGAAVATMAREPARAVRPRPIVEGWIAIAKPVRIYSFEAPAFRGSPATYTARRHTPDGGREDTLAFGTFGGTAPMLRISVFRRAREAADTAPLASVLASTAAAAGLTSVEEGPFRPLQRDAAKGPANDAGEGIATRFGRVEVSDLVLSGGGKLASCDGFRLAVDQPALTVTGLVCAANGRPMPRKALGCLIERLDLASARDDRTLIDFFAASELRRDSGCVGMGLGPNAVHAAWLDDISDTPDESSRRR